MADSGANWVRPALAGDLGAGAVRLVLTYPDPILSQPCEPAGYLPDAQVRQLVADLLATMYAVGGRGLAAPQIGVPQRVFVMDAGWKEGRPEPLVMLDPEILSRSAEMSEAVEQCLSLPGRPVAVSRPVQIAMAWYDLTGRLHQRTLEGIDARIAQHETDHLDGRLIVDNQP